MDGLGCLPMHHTTRSPTEGTDKLTCIFSNLEFLLGKIPFRIPHLFSQPRVGQESLLSISTTHLPVGVRICLQSAVVKKHPTVRLWKYRYKSIFRLTTIPSAPIGS